MLDWIVDEKGRSAAADPQQGTLYRITPFGESHELAVFRSGSRRSVDRSIHPSLSEARRYAESRIDHDRQLVSLNRARRPARTRTPWGQSRSATIYGEGIVFYTTAKNEGFHVAPEKNANIPDSLRLADGWYQDDGDGARVTLAFPELFTDLEVDDAIKAAQEAFPEAYAITSTMPGMR